jgi:DNA-binding NtrC family response regulator
MASVWLVGIDEPALAAELTAAGHQVASHALEAVLDGGLQPTPDVGLVRPGAQPPLVVARRLLVDAPATAWVMVLPQASNGVASSLLDTGAADVCLEPLTAAAGTVLVTRLLRDAAGRVRLNRLTESAAREAHFAEVIGESPQMKDLLERVSRVSRRSAQGPPLSVLLTGETGTGKGLLARVLHFASRRRDRPFVELNCAAIPATLLESELFGHEKGAFTDARTARVGLVEAAHGGTIFLDEVSYLSLEGQAKLLTVIDTRRVRRLGGTAERQVDVQVIAASSHELDRQAAEGGFRPELLHRLSSLWFKIPPLRERGDDAVRLADAFLSRITAAYRLPPKRLSDEAREAIRTHPWPGNVRELFHALERAVLYEEREVVEAADLALHPGPRPAHGAAPLGLPAEGEIPPEGLACIEEAERRLVRRALELEGGNVSKAATLLKVSRDVLRSRIEKYGLDPKAGQGRT